MNTMRELQTSPKNDLQCWTAIVTGMILKEKSEGILIDIKGLTGKK